MSYVLGYTEPQVLVPYVITFTLQALLGSYDTFGVLEPCTAWTSNVFKSVYGDSLVLECLYLTICCFLIFFHFYCQIDYMHDGGS